MGCVSPLAGTLAAFLVAVFFAPVYFFAATDAVFAAADFFAAMRFFKAAMMLALPAALSVRFGFAGSGVAGDDGDSDVPLIAAQRFFCPAAILRRAAAETLRFRGAASGVAAVSVRPPGSMARSSAI